MSTTNSNVFNDFRADVIDINRSFSGIRPLIRETRHLSLNAETSSLKYGPGAAAFAVVVKNLNQLSESLGTQVSDIESVFNSLVNLIGEWGKLDMEVRLHHKARELMECPEEQAELKKNKNTCEGLDKVNGKIEEGEKQVREYITSILEDIDKLNRQVTELNQVAVRQCRFIAISSMIEAQRIECVRDGELTTVAGDINDMANRIGAIEIEARDRILNLMTAARELHQKTR